MKSTKKSLLMSTISLVLCFAMLLGTTYAWFTDEVQSGVNKIVAGNLDIELEYLDGEGNWKSVTENVKLFDDNALWEPGHTEVAYLKLSNKGTLALKYNLAINIANEVAGTNVEGNSFKLSDYIKMGVVEGWDGTTPYADRSAARAEVTETGNIATYTKSDKMLAGADALTFAIVAYMPEEVGNVANYKTGTTAPQIDLGITVVATQLTKEEDSFGPDYDIETPWMGTTDAEGLTDNTNEDTKTVEIASAEQLAAFAAAVNGGKTYEGYTVKLVKDIDLNNMDWTPIGNVTSYPSVSFYGIFDGQDHTIINLKCKDMTQNYAAAGLFGSLMGTVKNVNLKNVDIKSTHYAGGIVGYSSSSGSKVINCSVDGGTITSVPELIGGKYDNGDKVGGIFGLNSEGGSIEGCTVKNVTITAHRDLGGIAGATANSNNIKNCRVENVLINQSNENGYKNGVATVGKLVGRVTGDGDKAVDAIEGCTVANVTIKKAPTVIVVPEGANQEQTQTAVNEAVAAATAGDIIVLPNTDNGVKLPAVASGVTLKGDGTTKIDATAALPNINGAELDGFVMNCGQSNYHGFTHSDAVIKNCTIKGLLFSYNAGGEQVFENCTFINDKESGEYNMWAYGNVSYKNCTFKSYGKFVNVYNEGDSHFNVNFENCKFINLGENANKAAINIKETCGSVKLDISVSIKNCTTEGAFPVASTSDSKYVASGLWMVDDRISSHEGSKITVTVDNEVKYTNGQPVA